MQTVVETPSYLRAANIFSETEREDIVAMLAADPECGEVISGTGGFREIRVGRPALGSAVRQSHLYTQKLRLSHLSDYCIYQERKRQPDQGGTERPGKTR